MKRFFAFLIVAFYVSIAFAAPAWFPEGIQTKGSSTVGEKSTAAASSVLDIRSTTKGMLAPRMTTAQRTAISSPATGLLVYDTDTKTFWQYNATAWVEVGSGGGGGGRNYIEENPDAETDTTGWVLYADAAGSQPVNGTGGTAASTWDRTTSTPLAGDPSFLFTKSAANSQGEGVSFDFTIEPEDRGRMLQIDYSYQIASGTYATGDLAWYIYDVTNSRLIQPSAYQVENVGVQSHAQPLTFQTSIDSTSYRLILHVATTSASAYTAKFDSVKVGPQNQANGPPVTDWKAYTPTVTAISGTLTNYTVQGFWKQKGDSADYKIRLVFTGSPGTWSNPLFSLPAGQVIDNSKIPGGSIGGYVDENWGTATDAGTQTYKSAARPYTTTTLIMQQLFVSGSTVLLNSYSQASPFTWASGDEIEFTIKNIPIVGWSSNVVVSSSANTRPVVVTANAPNAGSHSSETILAFTEITDSHGAFNSNTFTAPVPGWYEFDVNGLTGSFSSSSTGAIQLGYKVAGGSTTRFAWTTNNGATTNFWVGGSGTTYLTAGQTLAFYSTSTSTITYAQGLMSIRKVDGPSQIQAGNLVVARYTTAAGQSTNGTGSATLIDFGTKDFDLLNSVTTGGSWKFTAPAPGYYEMCAMVLLSSTTGWADTEAMEVTIYKNGSAQQRISYRESFGSGSQLASGNGCGTVQLNATEYIDLRITQLNGSNINMFPNAQYNWVTIKRIGGIH